MDNPVPFQPPIPEPMVQTNNKPSFLKTPFGKIMLIVLPIICILGILLVIRYFFPNLIPFQTKNIPTNNIASSSANVSETFRLTCPIKQEFCNKATLKTYNKAPALIYKIPKDINILASTTITNLEDRLVFGNQQQGTKTLNFAAKNQNTCYIFSYIIPNENDFINLDLLPIPKGQTIATGSANTISLDKDQANLIVTVRKYEITAQKPCKIWDNPLWEGTPFLPLNDLATLFPK